MQGLSLDDLMNQRWSVSGPTRQKDASGKYWEIRVDELPDFFVAAKRKEEVLAEYLPALRAFLQAYLDDDAQPPLPTHGFWAIKPPVMVPVLRAALRGVPGVETITGPTPQTPRMALA